MSKIKSLSHRELAGGFFELFIHRLSPSEVRKSQLRMLGFPGCRNWTGAMIGRELVNVPSEFDVP